MRWQALLLSFSLTVASASIAAADTIFVAATDGPWSTSVNPSMPYGINDHTTPAILLLLPGANSVTFTYVSGLASGGILWPPAGRRVTPTTILMPGPGAAA